MGTQTRRWARPRRRARLGAGTTVLALMVCLFLAAALVRALAESFDWAGAVLLVAVILLAAWVLTPTRR